MKVIKRIGAILLLVALAAVIGYVVYTAKSIPAETLGGDL